MESLVLVPNYFIYWRALLEAFQARFQVALQVAHMAASSGGTKDGINGAQIDFALSSRNLGEYVIRVENVVKGYDHLVAVKGVSFGVRPGECFGLLGPNGAGKATLLNVMSGRTLLDLRKLHVNSPTTGIQGLCPQSDVLWIY